MEVLEAVKTRRSVRRFKSDPVREDDLRTILEAARWAPSWANTQCWRLVIVKNQRVKEQLAEAFSPKNPAYDALTEAPVVIAACAQLGLSGFYKGMPSTPRGDLFLFDLGLATENMALAANALGLATVLAGAFDQQVAARALRVPPAVEVVMAIPLGYPREIPPAPRRQELSDFCYEEEYGLPYPFLTRGEVDG